MDNYSQMAVRYLKLNKKRSIITIIGVTVAVAVLYTMLNLGWSRLLQQREELREVQDYEIIFLTETAEQAEHIMADDRVKSASIGQYYDGDYYNPVMYENALYINTSNPYRMGSILKELESAYGVTGILNMDLAATYMQGSNGNTTFIIIIFVLLISYIFAIFGVGIVRNAIQLSILEQIKDYGNLRCVGSTKGQLKLVVYIQGAILELIGNGIGLLVGFVFSLILGAILKWKVGFHLVPIVPILIAFLGDLYFAMEENCKVIVNLTPVSAIRGEYRIHKEKIKVRRRSIFGRIFGLEGDYAYKNIMRNPGRFHKTVWALGIGMAAFIAIMGGSATMNGYVDQMKDMYGYYHVFFESPLGDGIDLTINDVQTNLPTSDVLEAIADMKETTEAKRIYSAVVPLCEPEANFGHYTDEYLTTTVSGSSLNYNHSTVKRIGKAEDGYEITGLHSVICYGYDETDYQRYKNVLVDGTLDVSENGIVLVNGGTVNELEQDMDRMAGYVDVQFTDYKVGDTIDMIDMGKYRAILAGELEQLKAEYETELSKLPELTQEEKMNPDSYDSTPQSELEFSYFSNIRKTNADIKKQLIEEGAYKTYTIEGIVSKDVNHYSVDETMMFVLPLDRYYAFTATDESMVTGMQYHFDKFSAIRFHNTLYGSDYETDFESLSGETGSSWRGSGYPVMMSLIETLRNYSKGVTVAIIFVIVMTTFNIINTTASNLHLRRKEFAQLRVIGISKKGLMKMVMLEGVISSIVASVIGIILGVLFSFVSVGQIIVFLFGGHMRFPILPAVIGIVVSTLIICGSIYAPLRGLKQDMAADLAIGGD